MIKKLVGILCFATFALSGAPAFAQDFTLKIGDIQDSSTVTPGAIDALSFSFGVQAQPQGKATASTKTGCSTFNVLSFLGKETGDLFLAVMQGTRFDTATFKAFNRTGTQVFELVFSDVVVTSVQQSGSSGGDIGVQSLSLSMSRATLKLFGAGAAPSESAWSCGG